MGFLASERVDGISIHAPPRGATQWRCNVASGIRISIHAPPRGATRGRLFGGEAVLFQFTPLREGRRGRAGNRAQRGRISIHAPPRGATAGRKRELQHRQHFNSRPSARGDLFQVFCIPTEEIFQFTPLREGRRGTNDMWRNAVHISIHAPPRGATGHCRARYEATSISIHAPPRGATHCGRAVMHQALFQFTPLREGRPERRKRNERICNFNSRPSARGDSKHGERYTPTPISIHAPPRGATRQSLKGCEFPEFQFTPLREGRLLTSKGMQEKLAISIHAPPRGATIPRMDGRRSAGNFNSRPSARGDIRGI